jgi:hypothetical protein
MASFGLDVKSGTFSAPTEMGWSVIFLVLSLYLMCELGEKCGLTVLTYYFLKIKGK